jgi:dihydrofolate reductase
MRRVLLNLTTSLDGFVAASDGGIDWILPPPADVPSEYLALMESVDTLVMGRATYELSLELEGGTTVFADKSVYVFTSRDDLTPIDGVQVVREPAESFVSGLKAQEGDTIWLFGGGKLATSLAAAGLVDDYLIAVQPILLGEGIPLWQGGQGPRRLELVHAREWPDGLVELLYRTGADE